MRPAQLIAACAALAAAAAVAAPAQAATVTPPRSQRFTFNNTTQYFTAPAGVHQVHLTGWGGSGGNGGGQPGRYEAPGGLGANVDLDAPVNPGDVLVVEVGGRGGNATGRLPGVAANSSGSGENGARGGDINGSASGNGSAGGGGGGAGDGTAGQQCSGTFCAGSGSAAKDASSAGRVSGAATGSRSG